MTAPKVINAINSPHPTTVEVHFDQSMLADSNLSNPSSYLFNNGAYTTSVSVLDDKYVLLVVENLFEYDFFTVSVSENIKNIYNESMDTSNLSFTFQINRPSVPEFALSISSTNGRLKSGTNVISADEDSSHWYIMTESGLDIIDKISLANVGFVLDGYGFTSISVTRH